MHTTQTTRLYNECKPSRRQKTRPWLLQTRSRAKLRSRGSQDCAQALKVIDDHYKLSTTFARLLTNINTKLFDKANEVIHVLVQAPLLGASTNWVFRIIWLPSLLITAWGSRCNSASPTKVPTASAIKNWSKIIMKSLKSQASLPVSGADRKLAAWEVWWELQICHRGRWRWLRR